VKAWNIFYIYFITKEQVKATGTTPNKKYEFSIGMGFLNGRNCNNHRNWLNKTFGLENANSVQL
jgi:hypothetical protein